MHGLIFVNPFLLPEESIRQAKRLKDEFFSLGVTVDIVQDGYLNCWVKDDKLENNFKADFAIYLDKDKYCSSVLSKMGIRLFNSHHAIRLCDDKAQTYIALTNNGLKLPNTIFGALCYDKNAKIKDDACDIIIEKIGLPVVVKESFGSMGKGVYLANTREELVSLMEKVKTKPHLFQQYIGEKKGTDVRVIVIGGKAVAGMERHNDNDFRSNVALGGSCKRINLPKEFIDCAEKASKILGLDYCGVDILYGKNDVPYICEVNSNAFFFGFESATGINVAKEYAKYILSCMHK